MWDYNHSQTQRGNNMHQPKDAQIAMDGSFYKIGLRGKPFIYINEEWKLSQKSANEITHEIEARTRNGKPMFKYT